jgi:hypothetical protein
MFEASMIMLAALTLGEAPFSGTPTANKTTETAPETTGEKKGPPFADKGPTQTTPKPGERTWTVKSGEFAFTVGMKPGIPDPDQVTEILIAANAVPKSPHPKFGNRVPLEGAQLIVEVSSPGGEVVAKFKAHEMPLAAGRYGIHFTPGQEGIYTLAIRGKSADGKTLVADVKLPVKVWPLPAELQGSGAEADKSGGRAPIRN